jgi:hypothetical protein
MKRLKFFILIILFVATLVPTQVFHYFHVVSDLTEHYQHHKDKDLIDFLSHALTAGNESDSNHPDHNHSPFQQHNTHCATIFVSTIPELPYFTIDEVSHVFNLEKQKFEVKEPFILEVSSSIWQPPKLV